MKEFNCKTKHSLMGNINSDCIFKISRIWCYKTKMKTKKRFFTIKKRVIDDQKKNGLNALIDARHT